MNKEDKQRVIGKVVAINSDRFTVELLSGIDNFNINGYDDIHYFAQLNSYIIVPYQNYYIVAEVCGVREKDLNVPFSNPTEQVLSKSKAGKFLEVIPIGMLKVKDKAKGIFSFEFGVSVYPALYTDVLYIKEGELDCIFNVKGQEICTKDIPCTDLSKCKHKRYTTLSIGKSTIFTDYDIKIDIDKFFGGHAAILGNTGSGKSCTISSMVQGIFKLQKYSATGSTFIVFDVNGEYEKAFSELTTINKNVSVQKFSVGQELKDHTTFALPHWFFNFEEWALLLQASEKTQQPVLRNALKIASIFEGRTAEQIKYTNHIVAKCCLLVFTTSENSVSVGHRVKGFLEKYAQGELSRSLLADYGFNFTFGNFRNGDEEGFFKELNSFILEDFSIPDVSIVKFDLKNLNTYIDIAILYEEAYGNRQIRDYCSSLLTRAKVIAERDDFSFLNHTEISIAKYKQTLLGLSEKETTVKKDQVIVFNLSSVDDEIVEIVSCVLSRIIYEGLKEATERNKFPVNLILEEAHRYIGDDPRREFLKANRIFERIAKEGRKFGMFLMISSQRPSELSRTVLSQCSNFIVHRIQNPEDLSHIRQITPHISETVLKRMPSIPTQHALIFGHAVNLPTMFKVNEANPTPKSENNEISVNWFKEKEFSVPLFKFVELQQPDVSEELREKVEEQEHKDDLPF